MLQPFDHDPNEKNKHKFMVQSMFAPDGPMASQDQLVSETYRILLQFVFILFVYIFLYWRCTKCYIDIQYHAEQYSVWNHQILNIKSSRYSEGICNYSVHYSGK